MSEQILAALRGGNAAEALTLAEAQLAEQPDSALNHYWKALALQGLGRKDEALAAIDAAIARAPERSDFTMTRSVMLLGGGDLVEAQSGLMDALALNPNTLNAYIVLIHIALGQNNLPEAKRLQRLAERVNAESPDVLLSKGAILEREGDFDAALKHYSTAADADPDNPLALASLGLMYLHKKMPAFAETALAKAHGLSPNNPGVLRALIQAQLEQNNPPAAAVSLDRLLQLDPDDRAALMLRLQMREAQQDHDGVLADAQALHRLLPNDASVIARLSSAHIQRGDFESARAVLDAALDADAGNDAVWQLRAGFEAGLTGDAGGILSNWLERSPESAMAHEASAVYAEAQGDLAAAAQSAERALALSDALPMAHFVKLRQELREAPEAALARAEMLATRARTPEAQRTILAWLGLIHDRLARYDKAAELFRQMAGYPVRMKPLPALRAATDVPEGTACGHVLWSPPGARIERVFNSVAAQLGPRLLVDRNQPSDARRDGFGALRVVPGQEGAGSAMTWRVGIQAIGQQPETVVDWLPQWDAYTAAALNGAHFTAVVIDPRDALLNWMVFGSAQSYMFPVDIRDAAEWLAQVVEAVADSLESAGADAGLVAIDGVDTDARTVAARLQAALALDALPDAAVLETPIMALGGMPNQFPAGHWRNYRDSYGAAFDRLTPAAVRLGYPQD